MHGELGADFWIRIAGATLFLSGFLIKLRRFFDWLISPIGANADAGIVIFLAVLAYIGLRFIHLIPPWVFLAVGVSTWVIGLWAEWYHRKHHPEEL